MENLQEATNFQYVDPLDQREVKRIFLSTINSYHMKEIIKKFHAINKNENEKFFYEICATYEENHDEFSNVQKLSIKNESFLEDIKKCDVLVCDISKTKNQFEETKMILNHLEEKLESGSELNLTLILISTIMTWAKTPKNIDEIMTDRNYRKRRPHPCFNQHLMTERRVLNLHKKFKSSIETFVVCAGIIYGEEEDIFHYIFKRCYFNFPQVDIFIPASNKLPIIYIHDFVKFMTEIITKSHDESVNYLLAVQPEPLSIKEIVSSIIDFMGGDEMRIRICEKEEIFLMNEDIMTQRVYDHLTLDLNIQSELFKNFEFEITGLNFDEKVPKIVEEYYKSRNLRPIKILIEGSPFAHQNEVAKYFSDFYHIHHIKNKCFFENFRTRLKKKIDGAMDYQVKMGDISWKLDKHVDCPNMLSKVQNSIKAWNEKIKEIENILGTNEPVTFDDKKKFIKERLSSNACLKNQGYVMNGFDLNSEKASYLFLDENNDDLNELKPDVVIIVNRIMDIDPECLEIEGFDENDDLKIKQWKLKCYYDNQFKEVSIYDFFNDRNVNTIEISIDHDLTQFEIIQLCESLKNKIGNRCIYELSDAEKLEIEKIKIEIAEKEKIAKENEEKAKIELEIKEKEKQIEEWTKQSIEQKKIELEEIERKSLPVRHYLLKQILPKLSKSLVELARVRPSNPVQFLAYHLSLQQENDSNDEELDDDVVSEFKRLVNSSKCE